MNERIKELYIETSYETADGKEWAIGGMKNAEKFAELIVRECADFVREYPEKYLTHNQAREISFGMEEHFGVEE